MWKDFYAVFSNLFFIFLLMNYLCLKTQKEMTSKEIAPKLSKQSMADLYLVILDYKETQEAESIIRLTIIVGGLVRNS